MESPNTGPVVLPDNDSDLDSSLGNDVASSTQSISSSIIDYRRENGRTYHKYKDGKYNLPNDEVENERLDLQHHLFLLTYGDKLGLAPANDPESKVKRVLDVGTGTGIWAMDYADEHPETEVIGIDLSPIQPGFVPPNVRFIVDDIEEDWNYSQPFDYVHSRMMTLSIQNWEKYFRKIYDNLVPGGYIEVQEIDIILKCDDDTLTEQHEISKWCDLLVKASRILDRTMVSFDELTQAMTNAGFTDISDNRFKWPTNRWPKDKKYKELGAWNNENSTFAIDALTLAPFTRAHGWSKEEIDIFLVDVRKDLNNPKIHAYWPICSIYGKKPEA